jgi:hypothetical protein
MDGTRGRSRYVSFGLSLLLSHHVGDCPRRSEIMDGASDINCQQHDRLRNRLSHVSVWLYSSKSDLHLCIRIQHPILGQADSQAPDLRRIWEGAISRTPQHPDPDARSNLHRPENHFAANPLSVGIGFPPTEGY